MSVIQIAYLKFLIISVMSVKIKSILVGQSQNFQSNHSSAVSPVRCEVSRLSSGSSLKNLSHERYIKKLSKLRESSTQNYQSNNNNILQSLNNLEQQYQNMKNQTTGRSSMKKSIHIKGVPHTTSLVRNNELLRKNVMEATFHSRKSSFTNNQNSLRVVTIGTECQKKRKPNKKKGIYISLLESKSRTIKLY